MPVFQFQQLLVDSRQLVLQLFHGICGKGGFLRKGCFHVLSLPGVFRKHTLLRLLLLPSQQEDAAVLRLAEGLQLVLHALAKHVVFDSHVVEAGGEFCEPSLVALQLFPQHLFLLKPPQHLFYLLGGIVFTAFLQSLEPVVHHTLLLDECRLLRVKLLLQFVEQSFLPTQFLLQLLHLRLYQRQPLLVRTHGIFQFTAQFLDLLLHIEQFVVSLHHGIRLLAHDGLALLVELVPTGDVLVFLLEVGHLSAEVAEVDVRLLLAHRTDDDVLDEIGVQSGVEKHVLYASRNVLVAVGLHQLETGELLPHRLPVAVEDVAVHLVAVDDLAYVSALLLHPLLYHLALCRHLALAVHEPLLVIFGIDEAVASPAAAAEGQDAEGTVLVLHLIDDVGVGMGQVKLVEALHLLRNAETQFVGIVEEEDGPEQRTLSHALRADEMHVAVQPHLGVTDVRTVYKHYLS